MTPRRFLSGVLARDIRKRAPGNAQYTAWCDDRGFVVEDGVILRPAADEFLLTAAEPNLAYFEDLIGRRHEVAIEEVSDEYGILAVQGPRSRDLLAALVPGVATIPFFGVTTGSIAGSPVTVSRTGYSGDLGFEIWVRSKDALKVWDALWGSMAGFGVLPFGLDALDLLRIEAGLLLLDVDFANSPLRLDRRGPVVADRARLGLDGPRPGEPTIARSSAVARSSASSPTRRRAGG